MAVRPNYKKRYTREEYDELQAQEALAAGLPRFYAGLSSLLMDPYLKMATTPALNPVEVAQNELRETITAAAGIDTTDATDKTAVSKYWYYAGVGLIALMAAGPLYRLSATTTGKASRKRAKASTFNEQTAASLDAASVNATRVLASLAPAMGLPIAYIGVQMMEDHGMITKGLGDAAQTLLTVSASGQLIQGVGSLAGAIL